MMEKHFIHHTIPKQAEGSYYTIDFPVPEGLELVSVTYNYKRISGGIWSKSKKSNIVDLGLADAQNRFLGWSGSSRRTVFVGPYTSTKGYLVVDLLPGTWKIIIGAYKIPDDGLLVEYEISYTPKTSRWLVGDLHMHSDASDGQHDIPTLVRMAQKLGLNFIAISNHNNYGENLRLPTTPGLTLIPAVEWTHYRGHMNFFGSAIPFTGSFVANSEADMLTLAAGAKNSGALVSVNHPKCTLCPYLWESQDIFDLVEVWNGPMRKSNLNAIAWWNNMLKEGKRIPIVGGSDFHHSWRPVRFAHPVTWVYANSPSQDSILAAISKGYCYISSSVKGVRLALNYGDSMMGDAVTPNQDTPLIIKAEGLKFGMRVKLITAKGSVFEWRQFKNGLLFASVSVQPNWQFAYLIVTRNIPGMSYVRAISNPIYLKQKNSLSVSK